MPTIEISLRDLEKLTGKKLPRDIEKLGSILESAKAEVEELEGDNLKINIEDSNRPDLWCAEGVARELSAAGLRTYSAKKSKYEVFVNKKLKSIRPYIACTVVTGVNLSDVIIRQIMQQQEKIDGTYGRNRRKTSIGLYDFDLITFPLKYDVTRPSQNAFAPLQFTKKMTPKEILRKHPKGIEYGHILKGLNEYPIFLDAKKQVLSMPPIINSNDLGQVTERTKNILVEVTGTDYSAVNNVLTIMALTLADRGGQIYEVKINYPYEYKKDNTPKLQTKKWQIDTEFVNKWLGTDLKPVQVIGILKKAGYSAEAKAKGLINVIAPCYRSDIMHPVDIFEDIAIRYGYSNLKPLPLNVATIGKLSEIEEFSNKVREQMIGLGAQEVLNFTLTNKESLFKKMNLREEKIIEIENPVSLTYYCLRHWLIPSLLEFLSRNTKKEYPQSIFEVEDAVVHKKGAETGSKTVRKLAYASSHKSANFTEAKQLVEALFSNLGIKSYLVPFEHNSFILGRAAKIIVGKKSVGIIGEVHPVVLERWGLETPVVCFEINISRLI